jgi:hypothetical protein
MFQNKYCDEKEQTPMVSGGLWWALCPDYTCYSADYDCCDGRDGSAIVESFVHPVSDTSKEVTNCIKNDHFVLLTKGSMKYITCTVRACSKNAHHMAGSLS